MPDEVVLAEAAAEGLTLLLLLLVVLLEVDEVLLETEGALVKADKVLLE